MRDVSPPSISFRNVAKEALTTNANRDFDGEMKTRKIMLIICLIALPVAIFCNFPATVSGAGADEKAVRDADAEWSKAAGAKDLDKTVAFYADDATVMPPHVTAGSTTHRIQKI